MSVLRLQPDLIEDTTIADFRGEHIRKVRMDRDVLQREAANQIEVDHQTIANWELGRSEPALSNWPMIIRFLGFLPLETGTTLPELFVRFRQLEGISQATLSERLGVDESTVGAWERGPFEPPVLRIRLRLLAVLLREPTANSRARYCASAAPTRNETSVPTFPNTASRISGSSWPSELRKYLTREEREGAESRW